MSNYRRTSKPKTEHIKKGFTVFQKTITTIGSILGLITAGITIMNALDNNKNTKKNLRQARRQPLSKKFKKNPLRKILLQIRKITLLKKKHNKKKRQNLASRKRKKKIRKQQLRTLLHLLQVNLPLKMKNSPILQLQKIKVINNQKNSFLPTLERSYFLLLQYFSWLGTFSWTNDTCHLKLFHETGRTVKSN